MVCVAPFHRLPWLGHVIGIEGKVEDEMNDEDEVMMKKMNGFF